jgi:hypothetical protein
MLADPFVIENGGTDFSAPRIIPASPNFGRFRYVASNGDLLTFEVFQTENKGRSRHVIRHTRTVTNSDDIVESTSMTFTVDAPLGSSAFSADVLWAIFSTNFVGSFGEAKFKQVLNGEV